MRYRYGGRYGGGYGGGYYGGNYGGYNPGGYYGGTAYPEFDRNGDGRITESDYIIASRQHGFGYPGEVAYRSAFRAMDLDGNGILDNYEASRGFHVGHHLMNRY